jgi:hypothetical protein
MSRSSTLARAADVMKPRRVEWPPIVDGFMSDPGGQELDPLPVGAAAVPARLVRVVDHRVSVAPAAVPVDLPEDGAGSDPAALEPRLVGPHRARRRVRPVRQLQPVPLTLLVRLRPADHHNPALGRRPHWFPRLVGDHVTPAGAAARNCDPAQTHDDRGQRHQPGLVEEQHAVVQEGPSESHETTPAQGAPAGGLADTAGGCRHDHHRPTDQRRARRRADAGTDLILEASGGLARADELAELGDRVRDFVAASKAPATLRAYCPDWPAFSSWCDRQGLQALPASPETIAAYLTDHAGVLAIGTLQRRLSSIAQAHKAADHEPPTRGEIVRTTWRAIRRTFGVAGSKKAALGTADIRAMVGTLGDWLIDARDRAMVLIGFASAMRRARSRRSTSKTWR